MVQAVLCIDVSQRVAVDASGRRAPRGEGALILAAGKLSFFPRPSEDGFDAEPWVIDLQQRTLAWSSHGELAVLSSGAEDVGYTALSMRGTAAEFHELARLLGLPPPPPEPPADPAAARRAAAIASTIEDGGARAALAVRDSAGRLTSGLERALAAFKEEVEPRSQPTAVSRSTEQLVQSARAAACVAEDLTRAVGAGVSVVASAVGAEAGAALRRAAARLSPQADTDPRSRTRQSRADRQRRPKAVGRQHWRCSRQAEARAPNRLGGGTPA